MNGWLVIGSTLSDDVPMYLCDSREKAEAFAKDMTPEAVANALGRVLRRDGSDAVCMHILEFKNGMPGQVLFSVKEFGS